MSYERLCEEHMVPLFKGETCPDCDKSEKQQSTKGGEMSEPISKSDRRIMAEGKVSEEAREFMLEVAACSEHLGEDGMCECARLHFEQLAEKDAEIAWLLRQAEAAAQVTSTTTFGPDGLYQEVIRRYKAERERDEAREDTKRLDWLDRQPTVRIVAGPNVRAAIDAARQSEEKSDG